MNHVALCWDILPLVSRSFSLCIRILPKPLNEQMMVSYLFFRILDTIEDSSAPVPVKIKLFRQTILAFQAPRAEKSKIRACKEQLLSQLDYTYEKVLLENFESVVHVFSLQPRPVQLAIIKHGKTMAKGMVKFQRKKIKTFADQNHYSYYVAGIIGYLFNELLFLNGVVSAALKKKLRLYAKRFGLALQKINILRDIAFDIQQNRHYWPELLMRKYGLSYKTLCLSEKRQAALKVLRAQIRNALNYLYSAMKYVLLLPKKAIRVRMFCLIPLFMAIESYAKCIDNHDLFDPAKKVKITRQQVYEIVSKSQLWGTSNEKLINWFLEKMHQAGADFVREEYVRLLRSF
ncbi:MAG: squalene/phytoene synthase family protein [Candidatus Micrarchaeota archaeon]|nr:squalene/phytoene synthase family protein [Candidatus Micrarchaeota archaeon]